MSTGVWAEVVGQPEAVAVLGAAARAADELVSGRPVTPGAMTHAWLFTGPPGSGRTTAARAFAAALQCSSAGWGDVPGCGECQACRTVLAGTHPDVRVVAPEGLSIAVAEMRALVQISARRPTAGRWQVVIISDADRLTEGASNALLKVIEEPPERTVFLLCAPSDHPEDISVTIRSRCRALSLRTPPAWAIAQVLQEHHGVPEDMASWAASVSAGHIGRAQRLATDPEARSRRESVLSIPLGLRRLGDVFTKADDLVKSAEAEASAVSETRDEAEKEALKTAMGFGGTGRGVAAAERGAKAALRDLEKRQKSRATRTQRDALDLALIDLIGFYRDVLTASMRAEVTLNHPDRAADVRTAAAEWSADSALRRLEAVLQCREALGQNVKPRIAIEAMLTSLHRG
ncbi:DNA polymerase III subunit delta' [Allokutzneria sp. A3M-2-11 16]|uniref:DNA polymerase III subunit delta' n=1 Tax=Allokutzneria sp. A3M-2-11 16 TaxID=2962043 RepID=UPI0020B6C2AF|nr:DNA polymerase III subunit delta' [Allokutzneria sp. A3M-2-11 16]MCP3799895.1 DNA polymerase III subunit delta' [Allokutzneria sp. A3M-2-11 16]